ncbi:hypothetical protein PDJ95_08160 [Bacillus cereus]|uniref:hypothetical protein n=1 Tax=Bacillus cereus TaxID=1396 RepID=UPI00298F9286|nr:hypothetical protein [Bacillus cereus]MDA1771365.1 hypothetical protein [Bacillus cereus]MDA2247606.1 hypothetical protein [Bacillus cereus]MDW8785461.1 hypothetical protein [Bacillus cereus]MDZ4562160.1 hypothetical protein [Bacillus cereus]
MKKKILALTAPLLLATTLATEASASTESFNVSTTPPVLVENDLTQNNVMYGAYPPGKNNSVHNIGISGYAYQVEKVGYRLFTDKWIKGKSTVKVSIRNWRVFDDYGGSKALTVRIYNSSGKAVGSKTLSSPNGEVVTFSGLSSSQNYYVGFEVGRNGNKYSFNGSIY